MVQDSTLFSNSITAFKLFQTFCDRILLIKKLLKTELVSERAVK